MEEKVQAVERVFDHLDKEIAQFQSWSTLHCKFGCGKCCFKPDIEATVLEFLPFAYHLYKNDLAMEWFERLEADVPETCLILNPTQSGVGLCSEYSHRGLICRLFGYSARTSKYGRKELVTCEIIKTEQPEMFEMARHKVEDESESVPMMHAYYLRLHAIDPDLSRDFYPINVAIRKAIETVLAYYAYRSN
jgi:Fe-S-cluster containining protein